MLGKQASIEGEIAWEGLEEKNSHTQVRDALTVMGVSRVGLALKLCSLSVLFCFFFFLRFIKTLERRLMRFKAEEIKMLI